MKLPLALSLILILCGYSYGSTRLAVEPYAGRSPWVRAGGGIICRSSDMLHDRFGLQLIGSGGNMMRNISTLSLTFEVQGPLSIGEARRLALACLDTVIQEMNTDESARPYLQKYPSDDMNVEVFLVIRGKEGSELTDPDISMVSAYGGKIKYDAIDPDNRVTCLHKDEETLSEARAKLAADGSSV